ncbi:hypothetical protein PICSAR29_04586 [Mycobacterium avium subsp. paratuberculosis]|nr:hypothetical protein PICSAR29_04586 [Mycobacterium avium subsp. paratuberculosis]
MRSAPLTMLMMLPRSTPARSASVVLRTASSKAKLGAAEKTGSARDIAWIQRAGRCRNATGLVRSAG